jgi:peptide-methionine (R)-S-oxide reductase
MNYLKIFVPVAVTVLIMSCAFSQSGNNGADYDHSKNPYYSHTDTKPLKVTDEQWKKILPHGLYHIAREQGTERAYTGKYWDNHDKGTYYCAICGHPLYSSAAKFESHTGWPSFFQPLTPTSVFVQKDDDGSRDEVQCPRCHSHLGHVFDDGPAPTGKRYCMDGDVLDFEKGK